MVKTKQSEEILREVLFQTIEEQLDDPLYPQINEEFQRLRTHGFSKHETKEMIAFVLLSHLCEIPRNGKPFDHDSYIKELRKLPEAICDE